MPSRDDIAVKIDTALHTVEKSTPALRGARVADNYFSRAWRERAELASADTRIATSNHALEVIQQERGRWS